MHDLPQQLVNGLSIGAVYALIALGYTMVYGVLRLINFAHGDVYMVGAVIAYETATWLTNRNAPAFVSLPVIFLSAMIGCAILGFCIEFFCYRPLRNRPRLVSLITAIGVSLLLENLFQNQAVFGPTPRTMPNLFGDASHSTALHLAIGPISAKISVLNLITLILCIVLMIGLSWFVLKTRMGLALRAVSFRFDTARLMGINTDRVISMTFILGSSLAAVAGVADAMRYNVEPLMGLQQGMKAFVAAVLGGIGSIPGAVLGGLLMGLVETLLKGYILPDRYSGYSDAAAFLVLILVLLVRPTGLLGKPMMEKV
jgi:branched-chain amino acid transport system permease protein